MIEIYSLHILESCVAKWNDVTNEASSYVTTQEMESMYMKAEVKRAK